MTEKEQHVLQMIKENPFISQKEIAQAVDLSRPAVANIISSLVKQGYLLGKAYVVNQVGTIVCIGAANVDKKIKTSQTLQSYTSNPVTSTTTIGGVARNVAENLGRLGNAVTFLSVSGNDSEWQLVRELSSPFMNMDEVVQIEGQSTGMYTALLDKEGEMYLGLADMSVYDYLTPELLSKKTHLLQHATCIVMDLNCSYDTIEYVCSLAEKHHKKLVLITVSKPKMKNLPKKLSAVDTLIVNVGETEAYFNQELTDKVAIEQSGKQWLDLGIKQVVMTSGADEILYMSTKQTIWHPVKQVSAESIVDVTGAGDSFSAAFIDSDLQGHTANHSILAGMVNAYHTIQSVQTVRQNLTKKQLVEEIKEYTSWKNI